MSTIDSQGQPNRGPLDPEQRPPTVRLFTWLDAAMDAAAPGTEVAGGWLCVRQTKAGITELTRPGHKIDMPDNLKLRRRDGLNWAKVTTYRDLQQGYESITATVAVGADGDTVSDLAELSTHGQMRPNSVPELVPFDLQDKPTAEALRQYLAGQED